MSSVFFRRKGGIAVNFCRCGQDARGPVETRAGRPCPSCEEDDCFIFLISNHSYFAGPHRPTCERDKISRMQRELQRPEIEAKPDWHGRNEVEAIKRQDEEWAASIC
jgi:hypothetical protein